MSGPFGWRLLEMSSAQISALVAVAPGPPGNIQPVAELIDSDDNSLLVRRGEITTRVPRHEPWYPNAAFVSEKLVGESTRFPRDALAGYTASLQPLPPRLMQERLNIDGMQLRVDDTGTLNTYTLFPAEFFDDPEFDTKLADYRKAMVTLIEEDRDMSNSLQRAMNTRNFTPGLMSRLETLVHN